MWKDSLVRGSRLKYSYPSVQFSNRIHRNGHGNPWLKLFRDSLPIQVYSGDDIQMDQQIDRILRQILKRNSIK